MPFRNVSAPDKLRLAIYMPLAVVSQLYRMLVYFYDTVWFTGNPAVVFVYLGAIKELELKLKNDKTFRLTKSNFHNLIGMAANSSVKVGKRFHVYTEDDHNVVEFDGKKVATVGGIRPMMVEFEKGVHSKLNVNDKDVIDIGAYMGETALYFVIEGHARKVYAFEPVRSLYTAVVDNIKLNNLEEKIIAYNIAIADSLIPRSENSFSIDGSEVREKTLGDICKELGINNGVLKMDVEGAEYSIIKGASSSTLKCFSLMHIEYHYGYADIVKRLLEEGFEVEYTKPIPTVTGLFSGVKYMGDIMARRK